MNDIPALALDSYCKLGTCANGATAFRAKPVTQWRRVQGVMLSFNMNVSMKLHDMGVGAEAWLAFGWLTCAGLCPTDAV